MYRKGFNHVEEAIGACQQSQARCDQMTRISYGPTVVQLQPHIILTIY
jgi:hypothetical protein